MLLKGWTKPARNLPKTCPKPAKTPPKPCQNPAKNCQNPAQKLPKACPKAVQCGYWCLNNESSCLIFRDKSYSGSVGRTETFFVFVRTSWISIKMFQLNLNKLFFHWIGVLWQQREKRFSRWKERFFILTNDYLQCFRRGSSKLSEMGSFIFRIRLCEVSTLSNVKGLYQV